MDGRYERNGMRGKSVKEAAARAQLYEWGSSLLREQVRTLSAAKRRAVVSRMASGVGKDALYAALGRLGYTYASGKKAWVQ